MDDFGLTHSLNNFLPTVQSGIKDGRGIGGHAVLPFFNAQAAVQPGFERQWLKPTLGIVCAVVHDAVYSMTDQKPHRKMIEAGTKSNGEGDRPV